MSSGGESDAAGVGFPNLWGFSPAMDMADKLYISGTESESLFDFSKIVDNGDIQDAKHSEGAGEKEDPMVAFFQKFGLGETRTVKKEENRNVVRFLNVNTGDIRHILQSASCLGRWNEGGIDSKHVEYHYVDTHPQHMARALLLWSLSHDCSVGTAGLVDHARALLEIHGNIFLNSNTAFLLYKHVLFCLDAIERRGQWKEIFNSAQRHPIVVNSVAYESTDSVYRAYQHTSFWLSTSIDWSFLREKDIIELENTLRRYIHVKKEGVSWEQLVVDKTVHGDCSFLFDTKCLAVDDESVVVNIPRGMAQVCRQMEVQMTPTSEHGVLRCHLSAPDMQIPVCTDSTLVESPQLDMRALWDYRVRRYYGDRYDHRANLFDWDFHAKVQQFTGFLHSQYYKRFRETGMSFEFTAGNTIANNSLLTMTDGVERKQGKVALCGLWGDIVAGPYSCWALESTHRDVYEVKSGQFLHSVQTVAEQHCEEMLRSLRYGQKQSLPRDMTVDYHDYKKDHPLLDSDQSICTTTSRHNIYDQTKAKFGFHPCLQPCFPSSLFHQSYHLTLHPCDAFERKTALNKLEQLAFVRIVAGFSAITRLETLNRLVKQATVSFETVKYLPFTDEQRNAFVKRWSHEAEETCGWQSLQHARTIPSFEEQEHQLVQQAYSQQQLAYWTRDSPHVILNTVSTRTLPAKVPAMRVFETCSQMIMKHNQTPYLFHPTFINFHVSSERSHYKQLTQTAGTACTTSTPEVTTHNTTKISTNSSNLHDILQSTPLGPKHTDALVKLRTERLKAKEKRIADPTVDQTLSETQTSDGTQTQ